MKVAILDSLFEVIRIDLSLDRDGKLLRKALVEASVRVGEVDITTLELLANTYSPKVDIVVRTIDRNLRLELKDIQFEQIFDDDFSSRSMGKTYSIANARYVIRLEGLIIDDDVKHSWQLESDEVLLDLYKELYA